ncbi:hypothetical protein [Oerskovia flava]|uniref:hypothetical protein n=1 Tax=Oerskovia flava TaxID=2986422 RepID=UPI00224023F7|nr:hypothetical protein [Oerskovia sp. JB1-3-2]
MDCRLEAAAFDIASSAGWYSAIAGLLAGFALLAILLPLDHEADTSEDPHLADSVVIFTCAFFTLLILAFNYGVLSGRTGAGPAAGVAAHEQLLNGAVFGLATLLLLFGLRAVLRSYGTNATVFESARTVILVATATLGPLVSLALQFSNALDLEHYRVGLETSTGCGTDGLPSGVWINLAITAVAAVAVLVVALVRKRLPHSLTAVTTVAKVTLGLAVVVTVWTAVVVPLLPLDVITSSVFEHLTLAATGVATVIVAVAAWTAR